MLNNLKTILIVATIALIASLDGTANPEDFRRRIVGQAWDAPVFVNGAGWCVGHGLSWRCLESEYEICIHHLFGKTNDKEMKFKTGLCPRNTLLCCSCSWSRERQTLEIVLAESEDGDTWLDDFVDKLQPPPDLISSPNFCGFQYGEMSDCFSFFCHDPDTRRLDFIRFIEARQ